MGSRSSFGKGLVGLKSVGRGGVQLVRNMLMLGPASRGEVDAGGEGGLPDQSACSPPSDELWLI